MKDPLKVAICEDNQMEEEKLLDIINNSQIPTILSVYSCGEDFLEDFSPNKFDLILMDIFMDGLTGIDVIERIRTVDEFVPVAFITTSLEYTLESYRLSALRYIEKPYEPKAIEDILNLALSQRNSSPSIIVKRDGLYEKIRLSRIVYLEQVARQIFIYLDNGDIIETYEKLSNLLSQINDSDFFHCHKSYVINLNYVKFVDEDLKCFVTTDGRNVPIRRESMFKAKRYFEDFLFDFSREDKI